MPFGFHLAMDTLPSGVLPRNSTFFPLSGQRGIAPAFGYGPPHPGVRGTSTLLNNVLLSTHYGRCDSCPLRRGSARVTSRRPPHRLLHEQVSLIHVLSLPTIPSPSTPVAPTSLCHAALQRVGLPPVSRRSGLRQSLAGSPLAIGRIEFLIVRTGRSPPVASHTVSRRNLALRRVAVTFGYRPESVYLDRTFTSLTKTRFQAHKAADSPARGGPQRGRGESALPP